MSNVYNRGRELKERKIERNFKPERELAYKKEPIIEDLDLHNEIIDNINKIDSVQLHDWIVKDLRARYGDDELSKESFDYYKGLADKKKAVIEKRKNKSFAKTQSKLVSAQESIDTFSEKKKSEEKTKEKERVFEDNDHLKAKEEKYYDSELKPISKWKIFANFLKSPLSRILLFVILGVFLMLYLTRNSMANALESPLFMILAVVFIILVLGRGGKTKRYTAQPQY